MCKRAFLVPDHDDGEGRIGFTDISKGYETMAGHNGGIPLPPSLTLRRENPDLANEYIAEGTIEKGLTVFLCMRLGIAVAAVVRVFATASP